MNNDAISSEVLNSAQCADLIATYEEVFNTPAEQKITYYFADYSMHDIKYGIDPQRIQTRYLQALDIMGLTNDEYMSLSHTRYVYRGDLRNDMISKASAQIAKDMSIPQHSTQVPKASTPITMP